MIAVFKEARLVVGVGKFDYLKSEGKARMIKLL